MPEEKNTGSNQSQSSNQTTTNQNANQADTKPNADVKPPVFSEIRKSITGGIKK